MEQESSEVVVMREERPSQLHPQLETLPVTADPLRSRVAMKMMEKRKQILTLLGGFIVCLSFGSGKIF